MFPSIMICPATCELCGQWMPGHSVCVKFIIVCTYIVLLIFFFFRMIVLEVEFIHHNGL